MKFIFSDSLDFVDPAYDFVAEKSASRRRSQTDDQYPHEHLGYAPYDGVLVSRAIVGDERRSGKYSSAQGMRFRREGARAFLRLSNERFSKLWLMGDCGAFSYRNEFEPPYTSEDMAEFYEDAGFTHGCSVDHLIFDFDERNPSPSSEAARRSELTLANARSFLDAVRPLGANFTPLGVVQGWSPASMATAAASLVKMGYRYLAVGGMVPLRIEQIEVALTAIRDAVPAQTRLHVLGFGKTDQLDRLAAHRVTSFDTTSPLLRAFKDGKRNYYSRGPSGLLEYYTAIRIPQAIDNDKLLRRAKRGRLDQESLIRLEAEALEAVRTFALGRAAVADAVEAVLAYGRYALWDDAVSDQRNEARLETLGTSYLKTLSGRPWEKCGCRVCRDSGVETVIFRSSNRNKRRGMHNLHVFYECLGALEQADGVSL